MMLVTVADILLRSGIDTFSTSSEDGWTCDEDVKMVANASSYVERSKNRPRHDTMVGLMSMVPNNNHGATITPTAKERPD